MRVARITNRAAAVNNLSCAARVARVVRAEGKENARVIGRPIHTLPHIVHAATGIALAGITLTHDQDGSRRWR